MKRLSVPVRRLAWGTDFHLNFLSPELRGRFFRQMETENADAYAITGDISDGRNLEADLTLMAETLTHPVFLLLGNHDRYHTSFEGAEEIVRRVMEKHSRLHRLTGDEIVELAPRTALIGVDGWADGQAGSGSESQVVLNDSIMIEDLANLRKAALFARMQAKAETFTRAVTPALQLAMEKYPNVILLTHVPPFAEAAWHEGQSSDPEYLPHFSNPTLGKVLLATAVKYPDHKLTVYCGHTHGEGVYTAGNVTVYTGPAKYSAPKIDRVVEIAQ